MGMIRTVPDGNLLSAQLVATADNLEAVQLARTLLGRQGDALPERGNEGEASNLLFTSSAYLAPIETIAAVRKTAPSLTRGEVEDLWWQVTGWNP